MLPPGHLAGGFLAGKLVSLVIPELNQGQYLTMSTLFGLLPDLDFFVVFFKNRKLIMDEKINHHEFVSHAPLLYLAIFLLWFALFPNSWLIAATFIIGTWSHFVLDTVASDGAQWFYPFSKKMYRLNRDPKIPHPEQKFLAFWIDFIKQYIRLNSFKLEAAISVIAILTLILSK